MKRGIISIIILAICIVSSVSVNLTLERKAESIYYKAVDAANDKSSAYALEKEWEKEIVYFKLFTDHGYFENIDKNIKKLQYLNGETYINTCTETIIDLVELKEHLAFSVTNIF